RLDINIHATSLQEEHVSYLFKNVSDIKRGNSKIMSTKCGMQDGSIFAPVAHSGSAHLNSNIASTRGLFFKAVLMILSPFLCAFVIDSNEY
ncbi:MAG: hypothetical protein KBI12_09010, partial [Methanothrix sp.]|nr:hypothetical protein [Methanothrix sp.]